MQNWMIYGVTGYTGELIAREAKKRGLNPVIAGRNKDRISSLAEELGLEYRIFDLLNPQQIHEHLAGMQLVLNCAGPFSATAAPLIKACIESGVHYLDITGELSVFEYAHSQNLNAERHNTLLCPGVGFDVIPTDCIAAKLKEALPDANYIALGFDSNSSLSPGTTKTAIESLALGGRVRINGTITTVPLTWKTRQIDFGKGEKLAVTVPWGDVSTAYYTTGIPNVEVYIPVHPKRLPLLKLANSLRWVLGLNVIQRLLKEKAAKLKGPNTEQREKLFTCLWGEVKNSRGESRVLRMTTSNGYALTIHGSLAVVEYVLQNTLKGGYKTPSQLMGADFVTGLPGTQIIV